MAKCKYTVKENSKTGTHSCYAVPVPAGLLTFDELVKEASSKTTYEESVIRAAIEEYMKVVQLNALKGFRCQLGKDFLTVYPNITSSVKDYTDPKTHELVVATPAMVTARNAKSRLGCTVNPKFSDLFEREVTWQKVDQTGAAVDEEDITQGNGNTVTASLDDDYTMSFEYVAEANEQLKDTFTAERGVWGAALVK